MSQINAGKVLEFAVKHVGDAVNAVELFKHLFGKGSDKKKAAKEIIELAIANAPQFTHNEKALRAIPEIQQAIDAAIECQVAVMNAKKSLDKAKQELADVIAIFAKKAA